MPSLIDRSSPNFERRIEMKQALLKSTCACVMAAVILLTGAGPAAAAVEPVPTAPASRYAADDGNGSPRDDRSDADRGGNGLWGLLGLVGLLGLAGLARRGPKPGAMAGYPASGADAPPVNTYPPAEPRRHPPGT
ncbi:WGxxGxxG family protein [Amycolatopsis sp. lyj-90]|uniref:WGxxGxxG family protein n=1 Tax=Amycolatopsis sp. lyj-90 TaxID=2789285 RepID=UPI00397E5DB9